MTLQSSGQISFGDINVELGFSRTSQLSIGSSSSRGLSGVLSGSIREAADFYGKSSYLDQQILYSADDYYLDNSFVLQLQRGYNSTAPFGSIDDGTFNPFGGSGINRLVWDSFNSGASDAGLGYFYFYVNGIHSNSGWTNMTFITDGVAGSTYTRSSGNYFTTSLPLTCYLWGDTHCPIPATGFTVVRFT